MTFDKKKYDNDYKKEHYIQFKVNLKKEENEELEKMLKEDKKTKTEFLRKAIENYKNERGK